MNDWTQFLDKIDKLSQQIYDFDKKVDMELQAIRYELESIKQLDAQQNAILDEHQQRTTELRRDNELREQALKQEIVKLDGRVLELEISRKWWETAQKRFLLVLSGIAAIIGIIYSITRIIS